VRRITSISEGMMMVMLFVDDEDGTSPHAKGVPVMMSISLDDGLEENILPSK
jgi:hypothetical protein